MRIKRNMWVVGLACVAALTRQGQTAIPDAELSYGAAAYVSPILDWPTSASDAKRRKSRVRQFKRLLALTLSDRTIERWPGRQTADCVYPLMGIWGDGAWAPSWSERCRELTGESQGYFYFSYNPFQQTETIQRIEIVVPGAGWPMKKELLGHLNHILGKSVAIIPKGSPKGSRPVWRWKPGKGKAILREEVVGIKKTPVMRFIWYRPAQARPVTVEPPARYIATQVADQRLH